VAQRKQLDLVGALASAAQDDQLEEATRHRVAEGNDHSSILPDASSGACCGASIERESIVGTLQVVGSLQEVL
jgi:hypothetical protein